MKSKGGLPAGWVFFGVLIVTLPAFVLYWPRAEADFARTQLKNELSGVTRDFAKIGRAHV